MHFVLEKSIKQDYSWFLIWYIFFLILTQSVPSKKKSHPGEIPTSKNYILKSYLSPKTQPIAAVIHTYQLLEHAKIPYSFRFMDLFLCHFCFYSKTYSLTQNGPIKMQYYLLLCILMFKLWIWCMQLRRRSIGETERYK